MLTKLIIRNFKRFDDVEIELGNPVVFVGPNNSGKSTALQALALWDIGLKRWAEKRIPRNNGEPPEARTGRNPAASPLKRPGVAINRRDLVAVPVPDANLLWRNLHVRDVHRTNGKQETHNIRVDVVVEGVTNGQAWQCGLEFDYANDESLYCRPLRLSDDRDPERMAVPEEATSVQVAFLPPMSGLAEQETFLQPGAVNVLLGQGRTAEVLRNLCYQVLMGPDGAKRWRDLSTRIRSLFGVELEEPVFLPERGEIRMSYREQSGPKLDISSSGRGLQQTLLLLAHMAANPGAVLLLDEPDAHLEILRQRQIYQILTEAARDHGSQIIAASHSEVVLNEAADRDVVVAFVGRKPHRIDDRGSQLLKSLKEIGFDHYYQAEQTGWVLYLEGSTDLAILREFAKLLGHPAQAVLERPFVHYVENQPLKAVEHFHGLREAREDLVGFALYDRLGRDLPQQPVLRQRMWKQREIENYLCHREVLVAWAQDTGYTSDGALFAPSWAQAMAESIAEVEQALATLRRVSPWDPGTKATDDFLDPLFDAFYRRLDLPNLMRKTDYHRLAQYVPAERIDPEVTGVLDEIAEVATLAQPYNDQ